MRVRADPAGPCAELRFARDAVLALSTREPGVDDDTVSHLDVMHLAAGLGDVAGDVASEYVRAVEDHPCALDTLASEDIEPVQRTGPHSNFDVIRPDDRFRYIAVLQCVEAAVFRDVDRLHTWWLHRSFEG